MDGCNDIIIPSIDNQIEFIIINIKSSYNNHQLSTSQSSTRPYQIDPSIHDSLTSLFKGNSEIGEKTVKWVSTVNRSIYTIPPNPSIPRQSNPSISHQSNPSISRQSNPSILANLTQVFPINLTQVSWSI